MVDPSALAEFGVVGAADVLPGGSRPVLRVGNIVLKRLSPTALEHDRSLDLVPWLSERLRRLPQEGFRLPRPIRTRDGAWMTADHWTASTFVEGRHTGPEDVPVCVEAIRHLHDALRALPKHPLLDQNQSVFGRADRACWGDRPADVRPAVAPLIDALYAARQPIGGLQNQVIHGDLNPENVLIAPDQPPAFLDVAPFWRPPELAVAMFANWIGPRRGDPSVLRHFASVPHFDQLLIRAGIRMLLIMTNLDGVDASSEARAARIILDYVRPGGAAGRQP